MTSPLTIPRRHVARTNPPQFECVSCWWNFTHKSLPIQFVIYLRCSRGLSFGTCSTCLSLLPLSRARYMCDVWWDYERIRGFRSETFISASYYDWRQHQQMMTNEQVSKSRVLAKRFTFGLSNGTWQIPPLPICHSKRRCSSCELCNWRFV